MSKLLLTCRTFAGRKKIRFLSYGLQFVYAKATGIKCQKKNSPDFLIVYLSKRTAARLKCPAKLLSNPSVRDFFVIALTRAFTKMVKPVVSQELLSCVVKTEFF